MKYLLVLLFTFGLISSAEATTYYAGGGSTTNCTTMQNPATPASTIAAAMNCINGSLGAGADHIIQVTPGTYTQSLDNNSGTPTWPTGTSWTHPFTMRCGNGLPPWAGGSVCTIRSSDSYNVRWFLPTNANYFLIFSGFTLDATSSGGQTSFGSSSDGPNYIRFQNNELINNNNVSMVLVNHFTSHIEILNNKIHGGPFDCPINPCGGGGYSYPMYISGSFNLIDGNELYDFPAFGIQAYDAGGSPRVNNLTIRNNRIHDFGLATNSGVGIVISNGPNNTVYNNLIYNSVGNSGDEGIRVYNNCDQCSVYNNTVYNVKGNGIWNAGATNSVFRNNISYLNGVNFAFGGMTNSNNLQTDPHFINPAAGDFRLQSSSTAAVDQGTSLSSLFSTAPFSTYPGLGSDFIGTPRPQGSGWDIGAYEFAGAAPPVPVVTIARPTAPNCVGTSDACTISGNANNILSLTGTSTQISGAVSWSCNRCGSGTASGTTNWTTTPITLKSGVNIITVTGIDGSLNIGTDIITITFVPTFPGNSAVLLLGFEDGSGLTATDSSGNGNNGTLTNGPAWTTTGRFGKAIHFDGVNDFVSVTSANSLNLTQSFTLSAWVQPDITQSTFRAIIHKNSGGIGSPYDMYASISAFDNCGNGGYMGLVTTNGASGPRVSVCGGDNVSGRGPPLQTGVWTHLAATYDNAQSQLKLYKNGALISTTTINGYIEPSTLSLQIGASEFGEQFQGFIDEVRVYNFALPLTAASNTVAGASCTSVNFADNNAVATASIVGNMNCPIINLTPPSQFKLSAGATELKLGTSATSAKIGANP